MWRLIKKDVTANWKPAMFILIVMGILVLLFDASCISRLTVGIPCPACGMSRAAILFFQGRWAESLQMHPFFPAVLLWVILSGINRYILKKDSKFLRYYAIIGIVAGIIFYLYRMVCYFPDTEPMLYQKDNYLNRILCLLRGIKNGF